MTGKIPKQCRAALAVVYRLCLGGVATGVGLAGCSSAAVGPLSVADGAADGEHADGDGHSSRSKKDAPPPDAGADSAPADGPRADARNDSKRDAGDTGQKDAPTDTGKGDARDGGRSDARDARPADADDATLADAHDTTLADATLADAHDATLMDGRAPVDAPDAAVDSGEFGIAVSPLTLTPAFSPSIHDYYVRCSAGSNDVTVTLTAGAGRTIGLVQPMATAASSFQTLALTLAEGDAVVVNAGGDAATDAYWIRCLPHNFPPMQMTAYPDAGAPTPGYYLVGSTLQQAGIIGYAMVLDQNGVPVWYGTPVRANAGVLEVESYRPGQISYLSQQFFNYVFTGTPNEFEVHDLEAGTTTFVVPSGGSQDPHELRRLPNGDYLTFTAPLIENVDLTAVGFTANETIAQCEIQELDANGTLIWHWLATDHFDPVQDSTWPELAKTNADGALVVDVFHCNSIDVEANGDLVVSARQMDSVFKIEKATGKVLWKLGGQTYNKDGAPYIAVSGDMYGTFFGQHDVRILDGGLSMFDDHSPGSGQHRLYPFTAGHARGVIYTLDLDAGTATWERQYEKPYPANSMGSCRVADDGSMLIGWGQTYDPTFTEVDKNGNVLLEFNFPNNTESYRATKVPLTQFDLPTMRAKAGK